MLTCRADEPLGQVKARAEASGQWDCMVVDQDGVIFGRLRGKAWEHSPDTRVEEVMEPAPFGVRANVFLWDLVENLRKNHPIGAPVSTCGEHGGGRLVGMLFLEDVERTMAEHGMTS